MRLVHRRLCVARHLLHRRTDAPGRRCRTRLQRQGMLLRRRHSRVRRDRPLDADRLRRFTTLCVPGRAAWHVLRYDVRAGARIQRSRRAAAGRTQPPAPDNDPSGTQNITFATPEDPNLPSPRRGRASLRVCDNDLRLQVSGGAFTDDNFTNPNDAVSDVGAGRRDPRFLNTRAACELSSVKSLTDDQVMEIYVDHGLVPPPPPMGPGEIEVGKQGAQQAPPPANGASSRTNDSGDCGPRNVDLTWRPGNSAAYRLRSRRCTRSAPA